MATSIVAYASKWRFLGTFLLVLLLMIAAILLARKVYHEIRTKRKKQEEHDNVSNNIPVSGTTRPKVTVLLFFATWCGACKQIKNQWNAFQETYKNTNNAIRNYGVDCKKVDCSNYNTNEHIQSVMNQYDVEMFPTIIMQIPEDFRKNMGDATYMKMTGKITKKTIEKFVSRCIDKMQNP